MCAYVCFVSFSTFLLTNLFCLRDRSFQFFGNIYNDIKENERKSSKKKIIASPEKQEGNNKNENNYNNNQVKERKKINKRKRHIEIYSWARDSICKCIRSSDIPLFTFSSHMNRVLCTTNEQTEKKSQVPTTKINNFHWIFFGRFETHIYMLYVVVKKCISLCLLLFSLCDDFGLVCACVCRSVRNYSNKNLYNYV